MTYSPLANPRAARERLDEFGLGAKYALGQNFLVDDGVVGRILELADLAVDDVVLEVGPGMGTLTCALLPHVRALIALEADGDMQGPLGVSTADYSERFALVLGDALDATPRRLSEALAGLGERGCDGQGGALLPGKWVSNLPYAVAATLILKYFSEWDFITSATLMVQSEVADRIAAAPCRHEYGAYTVKLGLYATVTGRFQVPPRCFYPAPHVESAVIHLERTHEFDYLDAQAKRDVCDLIDVAFAQRRKTIRNCLAAAQTWTLATIDAALDAAGIDGGCRAETLTVPRFIRLREELTANARVTAAPTPTAARSSKRTRSRDERLNDLLGGWDAV